MVNTELRTVVVTADYPVKILDIYANNSLVTSSCRLVIEDSSFSIPFTLKPYTAAMILCTLSTAPEPGSYIEVRIAYEGGVVASLAQSI